MSKVFGRDSKQDLISFSSVAESPSDRWLSSHDEDSVLDFIDDCVLVEFKSNAPADLGQIRALASSYSNFTGKSILLVENNKTTFYCSYSGYSEIQSHQSLTTAINLPDISFPFTETELKKKLSELQEEDKTNSKEKRLQLKKTLQRIQKKLVSEDYFAIQNFRPEFKKISDPKRIDRSLYAGCFQENFPIAMLLTKAYGEASDPDSIEKMIKRSMTEIIMSGYYTLGGDQITTQNYPSFVEKEEWLSLQSCLFKDKGNMTFIEQEYLHARKLYLKAKSQCTGENDSKVSYCRRMSQYFEIKEQDKFFNQFNCVLLESKGLLYDRILVSNSYQFFKKYAESICEYQSLFQKTGTDLIKAYIGILNNYRRLDIDIWKFPTVLEVFAWVHKGHIDYYTSEDAPPLQFRYGPRFMDCYSVNNKSELELIVVHTMSMRVLPARLILPDDILKEIYDSKFKKEKQIDLAEIMKGLNFSYSFLLDLNATEISGTALKEITQNFSRKMRFYFKKDPSVILETINEISVSMREIINKKSDSIDKFDLLDAMFIDTVLSFTGSLMYGTTIISEGHIGAILYWVFLKGKSQQNFMIPRASLLFLSDSQSSIKDYLSLAAFNLEAQYRLGVCYLNGHHGLPKNEDAAFLLFRLVIDNFQNFELIDNLSYLQFEKIDQQISQYFLLPSHKTEIVNYSWALCYIVISTILKKMFGKDTVAEAFNCLTQAVYFLEAKNNLAICYKYGIHCDMQPDQAFLLFKRSAEKESAVGEYYCADYYLKRFEEKGKRPDAALAKQYFQLSSLQNFSLAQLALAHHYEPENRNYSAVIAFYFYRLGIRKNSSRGLVGLSQLIREVAPGKSESYLQKARSLKDAEADFIIGKEQYLQHQQGLESLEIAREAGSSNALCLLGLIALSKAEEEKKGEDIEENLGLGFSFLCSASEKGNQKAKRILSDYSRKIKEFIEKKFTKRYLKPENFDYLRGFADFFSRLNPPIEIVNETKTFLEGITFLYGMMEDGGKQSEIARKILDFIVNKNNIKGNFQEEGGRHQDQLFSSMVLKDTRIGIDADYLMGRYLLRERKFSHLKEAIIFWSKGIYLLVSIKCHEHLKAIEELDNLQSFLKGQKEFKKSADTATDKSSLRGHSQLAYDSLMKSLEELTPHISMRRFAGGILSLLSHCHQYENSANLLKNLFTYLGDNNFNELRKTIQRKKDWLELSAYFKHEKAQYNSSEYGFSYEEISSFLSKNNSSVEKIIENRDQKKMEIEEDKEGKDIPLRRDSLRFAEQIDFKDCNTLFWLGVQYLKNVKSIPSFDQIITYLIDGFRLIFFASCGKKQMTINLKLSLLNGRLKEINDSELKAIQDLSFCHSLLANAIGGILNESKLENDETNLLPKFELGIILLVKIYQKEDSEIVNRILEILTMPVQNEEDFLIPSFESRFSLTDGPQVSSKSTNLSMEIDNPFSQGLDLGFSSSSSSSSSSGSSSGSGSSSSSSSSSLASNFSMSFTTSLSSSSRKREMSKTMSDRRETFSRPLRKGGGDGFNS